jgi:hypothetical protein
LFQNIFISEFDKFGNFLNFKKTSTNGEYSKSFVYQCFVDNLSNLFFFSKISNDIVLFSPNGQKLLYQKNILKVKYKFFY